MLDFLRKITKNTNGPAESEKEKAIKSVMEKANWTQEYAAEQMQCAQETLGISFSDYNKYEFYKLSVSEQAKEYWTILVKRADKIEKKLKNLEKILEKEGIVVNTRVNKKKKSKDTKKEKEREEIIEKVMMATNWSYDETKNNISAARKRTGCAYKEYLLYRFYELSDEEQDKVFLISDSVKIAKKYDIDTEFANILCDKELTNNYFAEYLKRPWCVNTKITVEDFVQKFANSKRVIYKPLHGNQGKGIEAFDICKTNAEEIFEKVKTYPEGVVEQYVVQHPELSALAPGSVNTIRLVTISSNTQPVTDDGKYMDIAYSALRIGGGTSVVDNFHSGGMTAAVNLETGELVTNAADMEGHVFEIHPMTGIKIKGYRIPLFKEAVEMVTKACEEHKIEGYLGWDIAITEDGPVLIEVNLRPGVVLLSTPYVSEKKGMKHVMAKYL